MFCSRCQTPNFRTDRYCRHCGGQLSAAGPLAPVDEEVEAQLRKALALLDQGDTVEALAATQAALALEPGSPFGHSVLAHVYDRQGRTAEAIQQLEIVLRVHPQSTADREKLATLTGAPAGSAGVPGKNRRPLLLAGATACLVTLFGGIYLGVAARQREDALRREASTAKPAPPFSTGLPMASPATGTPAAPAKSLVGPPPPIGLARTNTVPPPGTNGAGYQAQYPSAPSNPGDASALQGRFGLPPVYNQPRGVTGANVGGLPPAVIGEISPLTPDPQAPAAEEGGDSGPQSPASTTAADRKPEAVPAEPIETDSGFIKVERTKPRVEAPAAPRKQGPPPSIGISFGEAGADSLLVEAQREEGRAEEAAKTGNHSEAVRRYGSARRLYENIIRRGGAEAQAARVGAENCRKALAGL